MTFITFPCLWERMEITNPSQGRKKDNSFCSIRDIVSKLSNLRAWCKPIVRRKTSTFFFTIFLCWEGKTFFRSCRHQFGSIQLLAVHACGRGVAWRGHTHLFWISDLCQQNEKFAAGPEMLTTGSFMYVRVCLKIGSWIEWIFIIWVNIL